jgi:hypothetical protein
VTLNIDFDWKTGVAAKDWTNVAKKGSVDVSQLALLIFCPVLISEFEAAFIWFLCNSHDFHIL